MIEQASLVLGNGNWAVKSDSLLGYKTIDGKYYPREFTFTRATTGTRVNEAGLVELVPYNLLRYSEEFDNAVWSKTSVTVTVNATTSPSGVLTADKLIPSGLDSYVRYMSFNGTAGSVYTFSFYAKADVITNIRIRQFNATELNGTVEYITINNQWQRFTVTSTCAVNQQVQLWIGGSSTWSTGEDIYVWGAQLVEGTEPLDYLPTTDRLDIARIDYSTGEPVLLLEPQRTNYLLQSNQFDTTWTTPNATVLGGQSGIYGSSDAWKLIQNTNAGFHYIQQSVNLTGDYVYSIYAKKGEYEGISFFMPNPVTGVNSATTFNLTSGTFTSNTHEGTFLNIGNGWYRLSLKTKLSGIHNINAYVNQTIQQSETGDGTSGIYIQNAQLELGSYPTSYIPTTSATVTRNQDVCDKTSATALIGQTEGTVLIDIDLKLNNRFQTLWSLSDGISTSDFILVYHTDVNTLSARMRIGGVDQILINTATLPQGRYKLAMAYKENDVAFYVNGSLVGTDNSCAVPSPLNKISLTQIGTIINVREGFTKGFALWKTRLTNAELATLTTI